jgi:hypothetical protein
MYIYIHTNNSSEGLFMLIVEYLDVLIFVNDTASFLFLVVLGLNSRPHACYAGDLALEPLCQAFSELGIF